MENNNIVDNYDLYFVAITIFINISEFFKRFIYIGGNVSSNFYYFMIFIPLLFIFYYFIFSKDIKYFPKRNLLYFTLFVLFEFAVTLLNGGVDKFIIGLGSTLIYATPFLVKRSYYHFNYKKVLGILFLVNFSYFTFQYISNYFPWDINWGKYSATQMNLQNMAHSGYSSTVRTFGMFSGMQDASLFMLIAGWYLYLHSKKQFKMPILGMLVLALYMIGSKTNILGSVIVLALFWLIKHKLLPRKAIFYTLCICVFPFIIIVLYGHDIAYYIWGNSSINVFLGNISPRLIMTADFFKEQSPDLLIGRGLFNGTVIDNNMQTIISEFGYLGFGLFLLIITKSYKNILQYSKYALKRDHNFSFLFVILTIVLLNMWTNGLYYSRYGIIVLSYVLCRCNFIKNTYYEQYPLRPLAQ
jgi:hypothetical protein